MSVVLLTIFDGCVHGCADKRASRMDGLPGHDHSKKVFETLVGDRTFIIGCSGTGPLNSRVQSALTVLGNKVNRGEEHPVAGPEDLFRRIANEIKSDHGPLRKGSLMVGGFEEATGKAYIIAGSDSGKFEVQHRITKPLVLMKALPPVSDDDPEWSSRLVEHLSNAVSSPEFGNGDVSIEDALRSTIKWAAENDPNGHCSPTSDYACIPKT